MDDFISAESREQGELQWLEDGVHLLFNVTCFFVALFFTQVATLVKLFFQRDSAEE